MAEAFYCWDEAKPKPRGRVKVTREEFQCRDCGSVAVDLLEWVKLD